MLAVINSTFYHWQLCSGKNGERFEIESRTVDDQVGIFQRCEFRRRQKRSFTPLTIMSIVNRFIYIYFLLQLFDKASNMIYM